MVVSDYLVIFFTAMATVVISGVLCFIILFTYLIFQENNVKVECTSLKNYAYNYKTSGDYYAALELEYKRHYSLNDDKTTVVYNMREVPKW